MKLENLSKEQQSKKIQLLIDTIYNNQYIPHTPFQNQIDFLTYESEELLYGGQAGGGKSDALLMSALQYVEEEDYSALLLRKTYKDLALPNAIMNRCANWLKKYVEDNTVKWDRDTKTYTFPSGATVSFSYLAHNNDLEQYQGAEFQFVGFDELTQFTEKQYTYLHSRLRRLEDSNVPIRMRAGTNPGGRGHEWVKKRFIVQNSPAPFIQSAYTDNKYLDIEQYGNQLDKLDELTRLQLKYGDWNTQLDKGLLCSYEQLKKQLITFEDYKDWIPSFCVIGIDPASSGEDKFAMSCLVYFTNNNFVLVDLDSTPSPNPEFILKNFISRNKKWAPSIINFEREAGSSPEYALKYWKDILRDEIGMYGLLVKDTVSSSTGSKYMRAIPHSQLVRDGRLFFDKSLLDYNTEEPPLQSLFNQYVYVHPNKSVMNDYPSPDELDSLGYAYVEMQSILSYKGSEISIGGHIG